MPEQDNGKKLEQLVNLIHEQKSHITSISASLEHSIDMIIGEYYTIDDQDYQDFANIVFHNDNELSFHKKIKMVERFLNKRFPEYLKENPEFIQRLDRIRRLRNKFAHAINLTTEEMKKFVGKSYFELGFIEDGIPKMEQFTFKDLEERLQDGRKLVDSITEIFHEVVKAKIEKMAKFTPKKS